MVNVTERAKDRLKELLTAKSDDPSVGFRLEQTRPGEFGVLPGRGRANDQVIEHQGAVVLLVGQEIAQTLEDTTIDYDESGPDSRLVMLKRN